LAALAAALAAAAAAALAAAAAGVRWRRWRACVAGGLSRSASLASNRPRDAPGSTAIAAAAP
jgi:hypothetical protein